MSMDVCATSVGRPSSGRLGKIEVPASTPSRSGLLQICSQLESLGIFWETSKPSCCDIQHFKTVTRIMTGDFITRTHPNFRNFVIFMTLLLRIFICAI